MQDCRSPTTAAADMSRSSSIWPTAASQWAGQFWIPKVYNGENKTFFYFNWERYRDRESLYNGITTVPNSAFRSGDLSSILGRNLGTDFAGRAILQNAIYDPGTATIDSSGRRVFNVFPAITSFRRAGSTRCRSRSWRCFPKPNIADTLVNNFSESGAFYKLQAIPSIKIDHSFSGKIQDLRVLLPGEHQ